MDSNDSHNQSTDHHMTHNQSNNQSSNQYISHNLHHKRSHDDDMDDYSMKNHHLPILPTLSAIPTSLADNSQSINHQNMMMNLSPLMGSNTGMSMLLPPMLPLQSIGESDHQSLSHQSMNPYSFQPTINQSPSHSQSNYQPLGHSGPPSVTQPGHSHQSYSQSSQSISQSTQSPNPSSQSSHPATPSGSQSEKRKSKPSPKERDSGYNRKDKSLGLLCENFIHMYSGQGDQTNQSGGQSIIMIDEVSKSMGIERRRIYDIVNILEAAGVVKRKGKNSYVWYGLSSNNQDQMYQPNNQQFMQSNNQLNNQQQMYQPNQQQIYQAPDQQQSHQLSDQQQYIQAPDQNQQMQPPNVPQNYQLSDQIDQSMNQSMNQSIDQRSYQSKVAERLIALKSCLEASEKETGGALAVGIHSMNSVTLGSEYRTPADVLALVNARAEAIAQGQADFPEDPVANLLHHNAVLTARLSQPPGSHAPDQIVTPKRAARPSQIEETNTMNTSNQSINQSINQVMNHGMHQASNMHHMNQPMVQSITQPMSTPMGQQMSQPMNQPSTRKSHKKTVDDDSARKDQSLGALTQVFLQMFLINETRIVSLEDAARWLLRGETGEDSPEAQAINKIISQTLNPSLNQVHNQSNGQSNNQDVSRPVAHLTSGGPMDQSLDQSMDHSMHQASMDQSMSQSTNQSMSQSSSQAAYQSTTTPTPTSSKRTPVNPQLSVFRSKTRRLYDIANVLCALGLIEKIHLMSTRKPAFRWRDMHIYPLTSTIPTEKFNAEHLNRRDAALKRKSATSSSDDQQKKKLKVEDIVNQTMNQSNNQSAKRSTRTPVWPSTGELVSPSTSSSKSLSFSFNDPASSTQSASQSASQATCQPASQPVAQAPAQSVSLPVDGGVPMFIDDNENRYWFSNPPHSFSIERSQMNAFKPLDFAYLPFLAPTDPSVTAAVTAASSIAKIKNSDLSTSPSDWPPHMSGVPPVMQASYIKDHDQFINMFSEVCQAWVNLIPDLNAKAIAQMRKSSGKT